MSARGHVELLLSRSRMLSELTCHAPVLLNDEACCKTEPTVGTGHTMWSFPLVLRLTENSGRDWEKAELTPQSQVVRPPAMAERMEANDFITANFGAGKTWCCQSPRYSSRSR